MADYHQKHGYVEKEGFAQSTLKEWSTYSCFIRLFQDGTFKYYRTNSEPAINASAKITWINITGVSRGIPWFGDESVHGYKKNESFFFRFNRSFSKHPDYDTEISNEQWVNKWSDAISKVSANPTRPINPKTVEMTTSGASGASEGGKRRKSRKQTRKQIQKRR
mgnify:CR=1 FL=1|tara:strand:- start:561 stop:1052 length:492 start_codon:yes stop_codon:yes gene_type:complete